MRSEHGGGKNNSNILKLLRKLAPGLVEAEAKNSRDIDLREWYNASWVVRGAVTHSHMRLPENHQAKLEAWPTCFPCESEDNRRILNLETKNATNSLEVFIAYGFQVFKFLSKTADYKWDILGESLETKNVKL